MYDYKVGPVTSYGVITPIDGPIDGVTGVRYAYLEKLNPIYNW